MISRIVPNGGNQVSWSFVLANRRGENRGNGSIYPSATFLYHFVSTGQAVLVKNVELEISQDHPARDITIHAMIQRTLLRQTRALSSSIRSAPRSSLSRSQFLPANRLAARPLASSRWYATEPEAKKEGEAAAASEGKPEEKAEDPVKKELEAKDKEILDLKVCAPSATSLTSKHTELTRRSY